MKLFKKDKNKKFPKPKLTQKRTIPNISKRRPAEAPLSGQIKVEEAKFSTTPHPAAEVSRPRAQELPDRYGKEKIVAQVRDPRWVHCYWEIISRTLDSLRNTLKNEFQQARWMLRVYDISFISFNGSNANSYFDVEVSLHARNWYVEVLSGRSYCIDIGLKTPRGSFITVARSNTVTTPLDGPSWETDEEWYIPDDMFKKLYGLSFGIATSPVKGARQKSKSLFSPGYR